MHIRSRHHVVLHIRVCRSPKSIIPCWLDRWPNAIVTEILVVDSPVLRCVCRENFSMFRCTRVTAKSSRLSRRDSYRYNQTQLGTSMQPGGTLVEGRTQLRQNGRAMRRSHGQRAVPEAKVPTELYSSIPRGTTCSKSKGSSGKVWGEFSRQQ